MRPSSSKVKPDSLVVNVAVGNTLAGVGLVLFVVLGVRVVFGNELFVLSGTVALGVCVSVLVGKSALLVGGINVLVLGVEVVGVIGGIPGVVVSGSVVGVGFL